MRHRLTPDLGRSSGEGNGDLLQYSYLSGKAHGQRILDALRPHGFYSPWNSPGQNTGVGSLSPLQGIFPDQGSTCVSCTTCGFFITEPPKKIFSSAQFSSVTQSCPTLCDPMNLSTSGLPVHHQLPEFIQTHVH